MRKWAMVAMLTGQLQEASAGLKTLAENQCRHLDMMVEYREERRKMEEERRKMEEDRRKMEVDTWREHAAIQERQHKAPMDLMALQTESMVRIVIQQSETTKELVKQQVASAERLKKE